MRRSEPIRPADGVAEDNREAVDTGRGAPARRQPRSGGQSREATEQALIEAALTMLRDRGILAGVNLREIAEEAQVTRGLAYHYFGSRQELLRAAAKREIARPREEVPGASEMEFGEWLATMLDLSFDYKEAVRLIVLLVLDHDEMVKTLTTRREVMGRIADFIEEDALEFEDSEAIYAAFASMSYGFSLLHDRFARELDTDPEELEQRVLKAARAMFGAFQSQPPPQL